MNNSEFKNWRSTHTPGMHDLTFAHPDDIFIFTRFKMKKPFEVETKQVLYAENLKMVIGYLRYIFIFDILNDTVDDLQYDLKSPFNERQKDAILLLKYWSCLGKINTENCKIDKLNEFCKNFNHDFNIRNDIEYEIQILNGADELRKFLIKKYSNCENFDKKTLSNFCSKEIFTGKLVKDFLDNFFYNL